MRARVTLTTDFGTRDSYVAELKGVLYAEGPSELEVIDLTHEIGAQRVVEAALFVRAAWPRFPAGTIHLVVVDPGVGSARRALAVEAAGHGQLWLGPDNGVMSLALADAPVRAVAIEPARLGRREISATFHGRDVFAPAAALLARGHALDALGSGVSELVRLPWPRSVRAGDVLRGEIVHVDRFGNLISNIARGELAQLGPLEELGVRVGAGPRAPIVRCYADASGAAPIALIGSSDHLELAIANGHAASRLALDVGAVVEVSRTA